MPAANKLTNMRKQIDAIDEQIQKLINQRAKCAVEVARIKQQASKEPVFYRPEREAQILRQVMKRDLGPLPKKDMAEIFLFIMAKCRALQQPVKIAIVGKKNSLIHQATLKHFGKAIIANHFDSIKQVFNHVSEKKSNFGIIPVETSQQGVVHATLDCLLEFPLKVCGEITLAEGNNITRFFIIGHEDTSPSGSDKTSLFISIANQPGALAKIFPPFALHEVNITFFESHPHRNKLWNYLFFMDIEGHQQDLIVQKVFQQLSNQPLTYTILGSYPKAVL